jgi:hypothetical protein
LARINSSTNSLFDQGGIALAKLKQFRRVVLIGFALAGLAASNAYADELPVRKSGFWQITTSAKIKDSSSTKNIKIQQCIDNAPETLRKDLVMMEDVGKACPKIDARKTATGYTIDAECFMLKTHAQVAGNFNTTYTIDQTITITDPSSNKVIHSVMTSKGEWLGACPAGWKAGDGHMYGIPKSEFPVGSVGHIIGLSMAFAFTLI